MFTGNSLNFTGKFRPIVCIFPAPLYASNEAIFRPNVMRPLIRVRFNEFSRGSVVIAVCINGMFRECDQSGGPDRGYLN